MSDIREAVEQARKRRLADGQTQQAFVSGDAAAGVVREQPVQPQEVVSKPDDDNDQSE